MITIIMKVYDIKDLPISIKLFNFIIKQEGLNNWINKETLIRFEIDRDK